MGFDESKHPRVPKGSGEKSGEWTEKVVKAAWSSAGLPAEDERISVLEKIARNPELERPERQKAYDDIAIIRAAIRGKYSDGKTFAETIDKLVADGANKIKKTGPNFYLIDDEGDQWRLVKKAERDYAEYILREGHK